MTNKIRRNIATNFPHQSYFFFIFSLIQELRTCVRSWKHLFASISFQLHVRYFQKFKMYIMKSRILICIHITWCINRITTIVDGIREFFLKEECYMLYRINMKYKWCIHKTNKASAYLYYLSVSFEYLTTFVKTWL